MGIAPTCTGTNQPLKIVEIPNYFVSRGIFLLYCMVLLCTVMWFVVYVHDLHTHTHTHIHILLCTVMRYVVLLVLYGNLYFMHQDKRFEKLQKSFFVCVCVCV